MDFLDDELVEILNIFRVESEEIIARLNNSLVELEKKPNNKDLIVLFSRDAHSLKGAARMIGFNNVQNLAHKMEDILGLAKENKLQLNSKIADSLYKTVDLISDIIQHSIDDKKENFDTKIVNEHIEILDNIKDLASQTIISKENLDFNREILNKYIEKVNSALIKSLIYLMKLEEKVERVYIDKMLISITELFNYFNQIGFFEIKMGAENVKVKLEFIQKASYSLTFDEIGEIQKELSNVVTNLSSLCEISGLDIVDYYSCAFEAISQEGEIDEVNKTTGIDDKINKSAVGNNEIEQIGENKDFCTTWDFEKIKQQIQSLQNDLNFYPEVYDFFINFQKCNEDDKFSDIINKIFKILDFVKVAGSLLDGQAVEIIFSALDYCESIMKNQAASEDKTLIVQQLEIVQQLLEMTTQVIAKDVVCALPTKSAEKQQKVNDFTKIFDTGEIKTLHVDSQKLDVMVNQVGELIATKIKTTKQLRELSLLSGNLEDWQREFAKLLRHIKSFDRRYAESELKQDNPIVMFVKQFTNSFAEQNKKFSDLISEINKLRRLNQEDDMKMRLLIDDFDSMIKNIRVLPLATVFHLFGRMVRDIAKERGKKIELVIIGSETSADKKIIEDIKNPLIHIIRNAIDHGIEAPEQRVALGKNPVGKIQINAKHLDNKILIEVVDDGQGFNLNKIKERALHKGFLTEAEISSMKDEEIMNVIFWPGFTTDDEVTNISGRGIGLDVVKSKIAQLNGQVKVISEINKGSCIQIELPVTMATLTAFLISVSNQTFAIPMSVVNMVICRKHSEILKNHETYTILHNGKNIPIYNLADMLDLPVVDDGKQFRTILIIEANNKTVGIIVDKLIGEQEVLHKKLAPPIHRLKNISGITTLASGETCLILNAVDLLKNSNLININKVSTVKSHAIVDKTKILSYKKILIVDDSITTRTLERSILNGIGLNIDEAVNPMEAFLLLKQNTYDLIISDIEMPEMSGFEFLAALKADEAYADIPVIIVSSVAVETNKRKAKSMGAEEYIVKSEFNQKIFLELVMSILEKQI